MQLKIFLPEHVSTVLTLEKKCGLEVWRGQDYMNLLMGDPYFHGLVATIADDASKAEGTLPQKDFRGQTMESAAAADREGIVAFIAGRIFPPDAEIYKLAVESENRRQGIGSRMLERFLSMARSRGVTDCYLEVRPSNKGAIAFYHLHGFVEHGTRRAYYKEPPEDALVMLLKMRKGHEE